MAAFPLLADSDTAPGIPKAVPAEKQNKTSKLRSKVFFA
jgi:hypothetical protein